MYSQGMQNWPQVAKASELGNKEPPNQDFCGVRILGGGVFGAAVADGVGSLADSHRFSRAAVEGALDALCDVATESTRGDASVPNAAAPESADFVPGIEASIMPATSDPPVSPETIPDFSDEVEAATPRPPMPPMADPNVRAIDRALVHDAVQARVYRNIRDLAQYAGATTLLYALGLGEDVYWGRVGDGALYITFADGTAPLVSEMSDKVYTTTDVVDVNDELGAAWARGREACSRIRYITLMTDGIRDALEDDPWPFLDYLDSELSPLDAEAAEIRIGEIVRAFPIVHGDDKTLIYLNFLAFRQHGAEGPINSECETLDGDNV